LGAKIEFTERVRIIGPYEESLGRVVSKGACL
jgi:hypothetical protein